MWLPLSQHMLVPQLGSDLDMAGMQSAVLQNLQER
jgi:hypothetical protein